MALNSAFYNRIEHQVAEILEDAGIADAPVSVEEVARTKGAMVVPYELGDEVSGVLLVEEHRGTIGFNVEHPKVRQRFTIAHELGHFILHVNKDKSNEMFVDKDFIIKWRYTKVYTPTEFKQEQEANAFAAALLMPRDFLIKEMSKDKYIGYAETKLIDELAKVFDVSAAAMTYRFADLNRLGVI
ncbi:MAG TPA: ImmA/IrrE family metallo-endopeptidase [Mucilaginibacter sp.]|jgi:Zn-dependent peptidase ImmA (M78 family)|nr:ImmA/IrrE family metallo-endopeptidase [Mucilaginibacter sp.]